jgi:ParB family chromosome partitioning protein
MARAKRKGAAAVFTLAEAATTSATHHALQYVPLARIDVVRNTRTAHNEASLAELTESVQANGVIQPITLRPHPQQPGRYQLAAGHRRYVAAQRAGLADIPAAIRVLTDHEFLEIQVLENLQREAISPADEALAFAELLAHDFTLEEIAYRVGKSPKFVAQRAKLAELHPFWMQALCENRLPLVAAHELARLPQAAQQQASQMKDEYGYATTDKTVYKPQQVSKFIGSEIMRELHQAAFPKDDPLLNPAMGACTTCPQRTGAYQLLFEEHTDKDCCLNAGCFNVKKAAFVERRAQELAQERGREPVKVSMDWNTKVKGVVPRNDYQFSTTATAKTTEVLVIDGPDAGLLKHVVLSSRARPLDSKKVADLEKKQRVEEAARLRANRLLRVTNELLAERLRGYFLHDFKTEGEAAHAFLGYYLVEQLLANRTQVGKDVLDYLQQQYEWQAPTGTDLQNQYRADGDTPLRQYLLRQLARMPVEDKVCLFFDLKIRDGIQNEWAGLQKKLAQLLPAHYDVHNVQQEAENRMIERFYSPRKRKGDATVEELEEAIQNVMGAHD